MAKDPNEKLRLLGDHLEKNPRRKYGAQAGKLIHCGKEFHAHRPVNENCPDCLGWAEEQAEASRKRARRLEKASLDARVVHGSVSLYTAPTQPVRVTPGQVTYEKCYRKYGVPGKTPLWHELSKETQQMWEDEPDVQD